MLKEFYSKMKGNGHKIEIVFVSNDKNEEEMNKELAELLKSNRKIINITPEDVIDVEEIDEPQQSLVAPSPNKTQVPRSSQSMMRENTSAPITSAFLLLPVLMNLSAVARA